MNASKENARQARQDLDDILQSSPSLLTPFDKQIQRLSEFLRVAERKLPREASFDAEKNRRKTKTEKLY